MERQTEQQFEHVIEGQLETEGEVDFSKAKLAVHAFVKDLEVARAEVDGKGYYKLTFEHAEKRPVTELRVLPAKLSHRAAETFAITKTFNPNRYVEKQQSAPMYYARYDLSIPPGYADGAVRLTRWYNIHGTVYAFWVHGLRICSEPLPGVRIQFYEVDRTREHYLGHTYADPYGSYEFEFEFFEWPEIHIFVEGRADIRARIFQLMDGTWQEVYESSVSWNIPEDFDHDYRVPASSVLTVPDAGIKPDEGFRFISVGLLPIDSDRIDGGYATARGGEPHRISRLRHQPFCGILRIFGLFAEVPPVASYKVQIAEANADGTVTGDWRDITDPLQNLKWNSAERRWDAVTLGPDSETGRYRNIDTQDEADWHEHALKVAWRSYNESNGYYALRIIAYDASGAERIFDMIPVAGTHDVVPFIMRIDNDPPEASISAPDTVSECGALALGADRTVTLRITAHDPEGHVLRYWISGSRGAPARSAGDNVQVDRSELDDTWTGVEDENVSFPVLPLPPDLLALGCPAIAYNFELHVWGSATDCYNVTPERYQRVKREVNLVVTE